MRLAIGERVVIGKILLIYSGVARNSDFAAQLCAVGTSTRELKERRVLKRQASTGILRVDSMAVNVEVGEVVNAQDDDFVSVGSVDGMSSFLQSIMGDLLHAALNHSSDSTTTTTPGSLVVDGTSAGEDSETSYDCQNGSSEEDNGSWQEEHEESSWDDSPVTTAQLPPPPPPPPPHTVNRKSSKTSPVVSTPKTASSATITSTTIEPPPPPPPVNHKRSKTSPVASTPKTASALHSATVTSTTIEPPPPPPTVNHKGSKTSPAASTPKTASALQSATITSTAIEPLSPPPTVNHRRSKTSPVASTPKTASARQSATITSTTIEPSQTYLRTPSSAQSSVKSFMLPAKSFSVFSLAVPSKNLPQSTAKVSKSTSKAPATSYKAPALLTAEGEHVKTSTTHSQGISNDQTVPQSYNTMARNHFRPPVVASSLLLPGKSGDGFQLHDEFNSTTIFDYGNAYEAETLATAERSPPTATIIAETNLGTSSMAIDTALGGGGNASSAPLTTGSTAPSSNNSNAMLIGIGVAALLTLAIVIACIFGHSRLQQKRQRFVESTMASSHDEIAAHGENKSRFMAENSLQKNDNTVVMPTSTAPSVMLEGAATLDHKIISVSDINPPPPVSAPPEFLGSIRTDGMASTPLSNSHDVIPIDEMIAMTIDTTGAGMAVVDDAATIVNGKKSPVIATPATANLPDAFPPSNDLDDQGMEMPSLRVDTLMKIPASLGSTGVKEPLRRRRSSSIGGKISAGAITPPTATTVSAPVTHTMKVEEAMDRHMFNAKRGLL